MALKIDMNRANRLGYEAGWIAKYTFLVNNCILSTLCSFWDYMSKSPIVFSLSLHELPMCQKVCFAILATYYYIINIIENC